MRQPAELACDAVRDRLDPFLDGDLDGNEEERLRDHLHACPGCREELRLAHSLRAALRDGLPALTCPPEVTATVLRVAREEAGPGGAVPGGLERLRRQVAGTFAALRPSASPVAAWAAVAALLLLVLALPFVIRQLAAPGGTGAPQRAERPADHPAPTTEGAAEEVAEPPYTATEVARAEREARMVLAAVAEVSRGAGRKIQDQIIEEALVRPARRAVARLDGEGADDASTGRQP